MSKNQPLPLFTRAHLFAAAFFAILVFLLFQGGRILAPFFSALLWAAVLALALNPVYKKVLSLARSRPGAAATAMTFATMLLVIGPAIALLAVLATQAIGLYEGTAESFRTSALADLLNKMYDYAARVISTQPMLAGLDIRGIAIKGIEEFFSGLASQIGLVLKNVGLLIVNLLIMLVALFFFFRNGEGYYRDAMDLLPFTDEQKRFIAEKFHNTFAAVINGVFLIAIGQGVMTGIGFALFHVPFPVLWGFLAAILSILPIGGAALVWVPGALFLFVTGAALQGVLLALWGLVLVSLPDNFLKPLLIGRKAKLPSFFLFLGILGGLQVYGLLGILFGPLIVTLLTAFIQIYREEFADK